MTLLPTATWPDAAREPRAAHSRGRRRNPRGRAGRVLALSIAATLATAAIFVVLVPQPEPAGDAVAARPLIERVEELATSAGLGLDQVEISGARFTSDSDILDAVDLANVRSYLTFDGDEIRARVERLPWVETATLERIIPNRLGIRITERRPFAVWDRGPRDVLIDATGRQLATVAKGQAPDLPRIAGEQAPEDARRLLDLVALYPDVQKRVTAAERVSGRRWRLILSPGVRIELPADADAAALAMLVEARPEGRLLDLDAAVIDLTVLRRITIRPSQPTKRGAS